MSRERITPVLTAAMASLIAAAALAGDTPEMAEQKRQMAQVYNNFFDDGVRRVFIDFGLWQAANWPAGRPVVLQLLQ